VTPAEASELIELLRRSARLLDDPDRPPSIRSPDPGDDYLIALAEAGQALIVSGDGHLLGLAGEVPVVAPVDFLAQVARRS
jgi:predicted nucleic acid-binding protein